MIWHCLFDSHWYSWEDIKDVLKTSQKRLFAKTLICVFYLLNTQLNRECEHRTEALYWTWSCKENNRRLQLSGRLQYLWWRKMKSFPLYPIMAPTVFQPKTSNFNSVWSKTKYISRTRTIVTKSTTTSHQCISARIKKHIIIHKFEGKSKSSGLLIYLKSNE